MRQKKWTRNTEPNLKESNTFDNIFKSEPGLIVTFGIRIGINHIKLF
jgi:hypothetical protein